MDREEILLKEYELCQQDNIASSHQYYQIVGIFMTVITALSGGLAYILTRMSTATNTNKNALVILMLGLGIIAILIFLLLWLKRVNYLADRNYDRMREIELELEMSKSWRVHIIDQWNKITRKSCGPHVINCWNKIRQRLSCKKRDKPSDEVIETWEQVLEEVGKELSEEYWKRLAERQEELLEFCLSRPSQRFYEPPSRNYVYKGIIFILIGLWVFFIIMGFIN